jgi:hypothetical protein
MIRCDTIDGACSLTVAGLLHFGILHVWMLAAIIAIAATADIFHSLACGTTIPRNNWHAPSAMVQFGDQRHSSRGFEPRA